LSERKGNSQHNDERKTLSFSSKVSSMEIEILQYLQLIFEKKNNKVSYLICEYTERTVCAVLLKDLKDKILWIKIRKVILLNYQNNYVVHSN